MPFNLCEGRLMKKSLRFFKLILTCSLALAANSYAANQYYLISSDSNNCRVHWHDSNKGFVYVTGSDCMCMPVDQKNLPVQWVINFGDAKTALGCYPVLDASPLSPTAKRLNSNPNNCELGDHCTQFQCLKLLFADGTEHRANRVTLSKNQCVDAHHQSLGFCNKEGGDCR